MPLYSSHIPVDDTMATSLIADCPMWPVLLIMMVNMMELRLMNKQLQTSQELFPVVSQPHANTRRMSDSYTAAPDGQATQEGISKGGRLTWLQ